MKTNRYPSQSPLLILLLASVICIQLVSGCKKNVPYERVEHILVEDSFDKAASWEAFVLDDSSGLWLETPSDRFIGGEALRLSESQGDGCAGAYVERHLSMTEQQIDIVNNIDTLILTLNVEEAETSGMGSSHYEMQFDHFVFEVTLPEVEAPTEFVFLFEGLNGFLSATANGNEVEEITMSYYTRTDAAGHIKIISNACGADLYAYASLELTSFKFSGVEAVVAD